VGKTSLGQSIARALGRKFVRISLGGVRDEAEIRGHRRTYIGALPGRIIQGLRRAGARNPVFMLDEVDKLSVGFQGDPAAALLEVLDPEQNRAFVDHYLAVPFDLSPVMFICTANLTDTIPAALLDRVEVLELPGYTEEEKLQIAHRYLVPRQLAETGLTAARLTITDAALRRLIREYTREAGVRNLERWIGAICRKIARQVSEGKAGPFSVDAAQLEELLEPPRFRTDALLGEDEVGVATGLAWTPAGGDVLFVEAAIISGKGRLTLTGNLGEVMQESAQAALTYARARAGQLGIAADFYQHSDVHIHVPAGAIPKDGPSAGITMATALISALTRRPVYKRVAMTGEITLSGRLLPIGGVKEKVLAAQRVGVHTVILPKENRRDLREVPASARDQIRFVFAEHMDEVLPVALHPVGKSEREPVAVTS
jgi:ATP-dependent Lon protease